MAVERAQDGGVVAGDVEDLEALQVQVAIQCLDEHLPGKEECSKEFEWDRASAQPSCKEGDFSINRRIGLWFFFLKYLKYCGSLRGFLRDK